MRPNLSVHPALMTIGSQTCDDRSCQCPTDHTITCKMSHAESALCTMYSYTHHCVHSITWCSGQHSDPSHAPVPALGKPVACAKHVPAAWLHALHLPAPASASGPPALQAAFSALDVCNGMQRVGQQLPDGVPKEAASCIMH